MRPGPFYLGCALGLWAALAQAAKPPCGDPNKIIPLADTCERNPLLAYAGLKCVIRLQNLSQRISGKLGEILARGAQSQSGNVQGHDTNLAVADRALAALEGQNEIALKQILLYTAHLMHPDDLYEGEPVGDPDEFLRHTACFADNKRKLLIAIAETEKSRNGIMAARDQLKALSGRSRDEIRGFLQAALQPVVAAAPPGAADPAPVSRAAVTGRSRNGQSDITGTKEPNP